MKILKNLFRQLVCLKNYQAKDLELMSVYEINDYLFNQNNTERKIKIIFIPLVLTAK